VGGVAVGEHEDVVVAPAAPEQLGAQDSDVGHRAERVAGAALVAVHPDEHRPVVGGRVVGALPGGGVRWEPVGEDALAVAGSGLGLCGLHRRRRGRRGRARLRGHRLGCSRRLRVGRGLRLGRRLGGRAPAPGRLCDLGRGQRLDLLNGQRLGQGELRGGARRLALQGNDTGERGDERHDEPGSGCGCRPFLSAHRSPCHVTARSRLPD
jgi:hypothetical protein